MVSYAWMHKNMHIKPSPHTIEVGDVTNIFDVPVHALTLARLHEYIEQFILTKKHALVLHANVHGLNLAYEQLWFRYFYQQADVVFCDGAGVMLGARVLGQRIPQRITYADWMWQLAEFAASKGFTLFLLGAQPGVAEKAAECLRDRYPRLQIAGIHHGYFDKTTDSPANINVVAQINAVKPDILLVAFGMPQQEQWLMENWPSIAASVALTGGAVFDYVSGELRRAPRWMTDNNMEWLGRLLIEPQRLWKRYIIGNPVFMWRVLKQRVQTLDKAHF